MASRQQADAALKCIAADDLAAAAASTAQAVRCGGLRLSNFPPAVQLLGGVYTVDAAKPVANGRPHYTNESNVRALSSLSGSRVLVSPSLKKCGAHGADQTTRLQGCRSS